MKRLAQTAELLKPSHHAEQTQRILASVGQLRKRIEDDPADPRLLHTESGIGYRLAADD